MGSRAMNRYQNYKAKKKMADGGFADGKSEDDIWGEHQEHDSSGEPGTNDYIEEEHPMTYMASGGMLKPRIPKGLGLGVTKKPYTGLPGLGHYAEGGEIQDPFDATKHETRDFEEMPRFAYGGEMDDDDDDGDVDYGAPGAEEDEASESGHPIPGYANLAGGGKLGSGARFEHLTHELAGKGAENPKALAAYIGRKKYGASKMANMAAKGKMHDGGIVDDTFDATRHERRNMELMPAMSMGGEVQDPFDQTKREKKNYQMAPAMSRGGRAGGPTVMIHFAKALRKAK